MHHLRDISIDELPRTAARTKNTFRKLGIETFHDLLHHFPQRYEDYSNIVKISEIESLRPAEELDTDLFSKNKYTIQGTITNYKNIFTRRGFKIQQTTIEDSSGSMNVSWFNQMYLSQMLKPGKFISVSGKLKEGSKFQKFTPESFELLETPTSPCLHTAKIIPVYSQTRGLTTKTIRDKIFYVLSTYSDSIEEFLPSEICDRHDLLDAKTAYTNIHLPTNKKEVTKSRERIAFNEIFVLQLASQFIRNEWSKEKIPQKLAIAKHKSKIDTFIKSQPFTLTGAQMKSTDEILNDLKKSSPMNRLLQGDVGSGKTIVAAIGLYVTYLNKRKALFMAPTEILAKQHFESLQKTFSLAKPQPKIELVTSKIKPSKEALQKADIIVGTHALISKKSEFEDVSLVVVDEQHKFGVAQRAKLKEKGLQPHLLSMTATPIPRTVTLTLYGELDISSIDEMPSGRKHVKTHLVPKAKRDKAYAWIRDHIQESNTQAFIVCPLIDESEAETMKNIKAARKEFEELSENVFSDVSLGLLHGKLKPKEKDDIMEGFVNKSVDILVSTPVVEVGIDVPNATVIVIEAAERFGLAQLHQLRGRVGRSDKQSYCYLFTTESTQEQNKKLKYFEREHDGFKLAQFDLSFRGGGTIFGTQQHGRSDVSIASLDNIDLIKQSNSEAQAFFKSYELSNFSELKERIYQHNVKRIARN